MNKKRIFYYIYDKKLLDVSRNIPNLGNRAAVVQSLIATYNLLSKCEICLCEEATDEDLLTFHSSDYLEFLKKAQVSSDLEKITDSEEFNDFNLGYDCPVFEDIYKFARLIAGSSLTAAKKLVHGNFQVKRIVQSGTVLKSQPKSYLRFKKQSKKPTKKNVFDIPIDLSFEENEEAAWANEEVESVQNKMYEIEVRALESNTLPVCINWFGGWHHAQRDEAGGFCYVNDIVIAIQYLMKFYKRVLYIDLDIHHGNGVENAFLFSRKVLTFSMHKYEPGFYPTTGSIKDVGEGNGRFYTVNAPLKSGITDEKYTSLFTTVFHKIIKRYKPECVVAQFGADCLAGDPLGGFNLTLNGIGECLKIVLNEKLPTMILGGGGYNIANAARCWTYLTSVMLDFPLSKDIPYHSFLHFYGPAFELDVSASLRKDENSDEYLKIVLATILHNLDNIPDK